MPPPIIGISIDNHDNTAISGKYESPMAYSRCVAAAGGLPMLLPHEPDLATDFVEACDGMMLTGGTDPATECFGQPTHARARPMDTQRQAFELALLSATKQRPDQPVLGICLGMQLMALQAGGHLNQCLGETLDNPQRHQDNNRHPIHICTRDTALAPPALCDEPAVVVSWHRQAVTADPGSFHAATPGGRVGQLRVVAEAPDGVVEAIDDPTRCFYVGVQWHPERGGDGPFNQGLIDRFVACCRRATSSIPSSPHRLTGPRPPR